MSQGIINLDSVIESCRLISRQISNIKECADLGELQAVEQWGGQLEGLRDKFFMKTVAAIPATKKCLEGVEKLQNALNEYRDHPESYSLADLKRALDFLTDAIEELLNKAEMRGTTLT